MNRPKILVGGGLVLFVFVVLYFWGFDSQKPTTTPLNLADTTGGQISRPFEDLTIPFLRARNYTSTLGQLRQVSSSDSYTSYLTDYDSDGLRINALLTVPSGDKPTTGWPAVVFVHGYIPPTQYRTQEKYVDYVDYLARNGLVVFKIDLRGHGESEGQATGSYYSSGYVIDTLHAVEALRSTDFVDPQSIGLWGHSMAGNIVLRSMAVQPDIPAGVIWAGAGYSYSDLQKYGLRDNSYRRPSTSSPSGSMRQQLFDTYGQFSSDSDFWSQVAPTNYLTDLQGAIQLHHATDDGVVNIGYSQDLNKLLEQTQVPHEFYTYASGGHNISGSSFTLAMKRTVEFFLKNLVKTN